MGSIIIKYQKCGKTNCKCASGISIDSLHGPYYWHVKYIKPRNSLKSGKYRWSYIGKTEEDLNLYLEKNKIENFSNKKNQEFSETSRPL